MPEPTQLAFSHKEVATALLKAQGIHEGIWGIFIKFGFNAMNVGASEADLNPTALVPVTAIGLQQFDKINNLSVDAALVNPRAVAPKRIGAGKTARAEKKR